MGKPTPLQCGAASFILPGLGHWLRGRYSRGAFQLGLTLLSGFLLFLVLEAVGLGPGWMGGFDISLKGWPLLFTLFPVLVLVWLSAAYGAYAAALREDRRAASADARAAIRERRRARFRGRVPMDEARGKARQVRRLRAR